MHERYSTLNSNVPRYLFIYNAFTAGYLVCGISMAWLWVASLVQGVLFAVVWIYFVPPLLCRLAIAVRGQPMPGQYGMQDAAFQQWWLLTQLQMIFNRFPWLEELLRLIPGLYPLWLNLWGAQVSLYSYWSPGVVVADRQWLRIGQRAILGGGCRIGAHVLQRLEGGEMRLYLGPVSIEADAMVGLHAAIGPGCHVHANETVPAGRLLKPFYSWKNGMARRGEGSP